MKKKLIAELDSTAGKTPWQQFKIQHGIETFEVLVPLKNAGLFEEQLKQPMPSKHDILAVLKDCGGELVE